MNNIWFISRGSNNAHISINKTTEVLVDLDDYDKLSQYQWYVSMHGKNMKRLVVRSKTKKIIMARFIMNAKKGEIVDHINGDTLDNRKQNLRICKHIDNCRNKGLSPKNKTGFKGVSLWNGYYRARIMHNKKDIVIGYFDNPIDAAKAYDAKAIELFREFARTNKAMGLYEADLIKTIGE